MMGHKENQDLRFRIDAPGIRELLNIGEVGHSMTTL